MSKSKGQGQGRGQGEYHALERATANPALMSWTRFIKSQAKLKGGSGGKTRRKEEKKEEEGRGGGGGGSGERGRQICFTCFLKRDFFDCVAQHIGMIEPERGNLDYLESHGRAGGGAGRQAGK
eukprot:752115-Hanusia_phi.AAC.1